MNRDLTLFPELSSTPGGDTGTPLRTDPEWWRALVEAAHPAAAESVWRGADGPVEGARVRRDGVDLIETTFLAWKPDSEQVMVHLNRLTDRHRGDLRPSLLHRVPGSGLWGGTFLLPADGIFSYRITDASGLPADVGPGRPQWKQIHERGHADPLNPRVLPTPLGGDSSVWTGPDAPWQHWPWCETETWHNLDIEGVPTAVLPGDERVVLLFDGQFWRGLGLGAAARGAGLTHTLVLVDTGGPAERARILGDVEEANLRARAGLVAASTLLGRRLRRAEVLVGQSLGGLAVAALLAGKQELARGGIVQSGSFGHRPDAARHPGRATDLLEQLAAGWGDVSSPVLIQAGTEEDDLLPGARRYRDVLLDRNAAAVGYREVRGGHDYAWWRHGVVQGLTELDDRA